MILLNFAHPLTPEQLAQVESLTGRSETRVIHVPVEIDHDRSLAEQVVAIADRAGLSSAEWQTLPLLVNPPGYAPAAAALLAELHGRMGYFPTCLRLRPVESAVPARFELAELIELQTVRDRARQARTRDNEGIRE